MRLRDIILDLIAISAFFRQLSLVLSGLRAKLSRKMVERIQ